MEFDKLPNIIDQEDLKDRSKSAINLGKAFDNLNIWGSKKNEEQAKEEEPA